MDGGPARKQNKEMKLRATSYGVRKRCFRSRRLRSTLPSLLTVVLLFGFGCNRSSPEARAQRGEAVFRDLQSRKMADPADLTGVEKSGLSLCLSTSEWQKLTKEQQIDLTYYAQHLVPMVRSNPGDYVHVLEPKYAAIRAALIQSGRKLCDDCWLIRIDSPGAPSADGLRFQRNAITMVSGDKLWDTITADSYQNDEQKNSARGTRASEFRKQ
jgi:hypothetical protein